jgi:hypothetical protein
MTDPVKEMPTLEQFGQIRELGGRRGRLRIALWGRLPVKNGLLPQKIELKAWSGVMVMRSNVGSWERKNEASCVGKLN